MTFENSVKNKNTFFIKQDISFLKKTKIIAWAFFLPRQIVKNIDMPRQNPRHLPAAEANFERCTSKSASI